MTPSPEGGGRVSEKLARYLRDEGALTPDWAGAFAAVPRGQFLPELVWSYDMDTGCSVPVHRRDDPEAWERAVYADAPIVTQWDDGRHVGTEPGTMATSSASMPYVVASMLRDLDVHEGMRVLEVGTGTGWNAALLSYRLGGSQVVSVEIDGAVAEQANAALTRARLGPEVVRADGREGWPPGAPYDRVIVTAGVRTVAPAWLEQTRPGGCILAPWGTSYSDQDALVRLTVDADGRASGPFLRMVEFMKLRTDRLDWDCFREHVRAFPGDADVSGTRLTLQSLGRRYTTVRFVLGLCVPDCAHVVNKTSEEAANAWFFGLTDRSWAAVQFRSDASDATVYQSGPRRLWDEVERAQSWWADLGRPGLDRFGLAVTPDGITRAWLGHPAATVSEQLR